MRRLIGFAFVAASALVFACLNFDEATEDFCRNHGLDPSCAVGGADGGQEPDGGADAGAGADGGDGGDAGVDGGQSSAFEDFLQAYAERKCGVMRSCGVYAVDAGGCEAWVVHEARKLWSAERFIPSNAPACLAAIATEQDRCLGGPMFGALACGVTFAANLQEGVPCTGSCMALPGQLCLPPSRDAGNDCGSVCGRFDACDGGVRCGMDEYCHPSTGACTSLPREGLPCLDGIRCHPDFQCSGTTCLPRVAVGGTCTWEFQCQSGLRCVPVDAGLSVCAPRMEFGASCTGFNECAVGLTCIETTGKCGYAAMVDAGEPCGNGLYCKEAWCRLDDGGFVSSGPGVGTCSLPAAGEACPSSGACGPYATCAPDGGCTSSFNGSSCDTHENCPANAFCNTSIGACVERGGLTSPCDTNLGDVGCAAPLVCSSNVCRARFSIGGPCDNTSKCVQPAECISGTCQVTGFVGTPCRFEQTQQICLEGRCNVKNTPNRGTCVAPGADGTECLIGTECESGYCDRLKQVCRAGTCP